MGVTKYDTVSINFYIFGAGLGSELGVQILSVNSNDIMVLDLIVKKLVIVC